MRLTFLGTRGNIDARSRRHQRHTATLVSYRGAEVMIDCGADWLGRLGRVKPDAVVLTHAHPDHIGGLRHGAPCAVYATRDVLNAVARWPLESAKPLAPRSPTKVRGITFEAFPVDHSINAPAVGYRITAGRATIFYVPDVLSIPDRAAALSAVSLYVGDGASLSRPIVRRRNGTAFGHASIASQLDWCRQEDVPQAVFTHCGTHIVAGRPDAEQRVVEMGESYGVRTRVAYDGLAIVC